MFILFMYAEYYIFSKYYTKFSSRKVVFQYTCSNMDIMLTQLHKRHERLLVCWMFGCLTLGDRPQFKCNITV